MSIIIPARNEERTVAAVLRSLARQERISDCEVFLVDGESTDATRDVAGAFPFVRVLRSEPGRAAQMNRGAAEATGQVLWFLHVDSTLPDRRTVDELQRVTLDPDVLGGCFRFHLRGDDLYYRFVNVLVNARARFLGRAYADQGIFVRRDVFNRLGGFRMGMPDSEDLDLVLRVRELGRFAVLSATVETSARTWNRWGKIATTLYHHNEWIRFELRRRRERAAQRREALTSAARESAGALVSSSAPPAAEL